jgi:hypothetical protein
VASKKVELIEVENRMLFKDWMEEKKDWKDVGQISVRQEK